MRTTEPPTAGEPKTSEWALADKISYLFDTIRRSDGKPFSNDEVADTMAAKGGSTVSGAYLSLLRRGERDNPTKKHLEALADFFDVSPAYFFDDRKSREIASELALLRTLADAGVQRVALRLGGLSPRSLRNIADIIERIREIEGLDADQPGVDQEGQQPPGGQP